MYLISHKKDIFVNLSRLSFFLDIILSLDDTVEKTLSTSFKHFLDVQNLSHSTVRPSTTFWHQKISSRQFRHHFDTLFYILKPSHRSISVIISTNEIYREGHCTKCFIFSEDWDMCCARFLKFRKLYTFLGRGLTNICNRRRCLLSHSRRRDAFLYMCFWPFQINTSYLKHNILTNLFKTIWHIITFNQLRF